MSDNSINNTKDIDYKKIEKLDFDDELDIIFYKLVSNFCMGFVSRNML